MTDQNVSQAQIGAPGQDAFVAGRGRDRVIVHAGGIAQGNQPCA